MDTKGGGRVGEWDDALGGRGSAFVGRAARSGARTPVLWSDARLDRLLPVLVPCPSSPRQRAYRRPRDVPPQPTRPSPRHNWLCALGGLTRTIVRDPLPLHPSTRSVSSSSCGGEEGRGLVRPRSNQVAAPVTTAAESPKVRRPAGLEMGIGYETVRRSDSDVVRVGKEEERGRVNAALGDLFGGGSASWGDRSTRVPRDSLKALGAARAYNPRAGRKHPRLVVCLLRGLCAAARVRGRARARSSTCPSVHRSTRTTRLSWCPGYLGVVEAIFLVVYKLSHRLRPTERPPAPSSSSRRSLAGSHLASVLPQACRCVVNPFPYCRRRVLRSSVTIRQAPSSTRPRAAPSRRCGPSTGAARQLASRRGASWNHDEDSASQPRTEPRSARPVRRATCAYYSLRSDARLEFRVHHLVVLFLLLHRAAGTQISHSCDADQSCGFPERTRIAKWGALAATTVPRALGRTRTW